LPTRTAVNGGYRSPRVGLAATVRDGGRGKSPAPVANKDPFVDGLKGPGHRFWAGKASRDFAPAMGRRTEIIEGRRVWSDQAFSPIPGGGNTFSRRPRRGLAACVMAGQRFIG